MPKNLLPLKHEPQWDTTEDDLGEPNGRWQTEHAKRAKYATALQMVSAIGRRPSDWIKRELLSGSSGDDSRNWFVRKVLKNNASFLIQDSDCILFPGDESIIREARAFDYMTRHKLFALLDVLPRNSHEWKAATAAAFCRTSLYETKERIPHNFGFIRNSQVCRNTSCCPHCYARLMADQYKNAREVVVNHPPEYVALLSSAALVDLNNTIKFTQLRRSLRKHLVDLAKSAGGTGGIWTQQIGPALIDENHWCGDELSASRVEELELRVAVMAVIPPTGPSLQRLKQFKPRRDLLETPLEIDIQRFDPERSLRSFMVKGRAASTAQVRLQENNCGLFYWPPISICSQGQWVARYSLMRNQPAARHWGSWAKQHGSQGPVYEASQTPISPTPQQRRVTLLRAAEPVLIGLGFPQNTLPGRVKLRELLTDAEIVASERDVRWLISHLS